LRHHLQQQDRLSESIPTPPIAVPPPESAVKAYHTTAVNSKGKGKGRADSESGQRRHIDDDQDGDGIDDRFSSIRTTDGTVNCARGKGKDKGKAKWRMEDEFVDAAEGEDDLYR
jgi:hypothetical protein